MLLAYTVGYNVVGLSLAALGLLPPIVAAAAHSIPDLAILANSSRLLRADRREARPTSGADRHGPRRAAPITCPLSTPTGGV